MGGRLAEEIYLDQLTTGASNDIHRATELARKMVCEYGMSQLGPLHFSEDQHQPFLGRDITTQRATSEDTARIIDAEVRRIVEDGYRKAKNLLVEHKREVELLAGALLEYESLEKPDIKELFETGKIGRPTPSQILASAAAPEPPAEPVVELPPEAQG
jgi:cell division protease FtsH